MDLFDNIHEGDILKLKWIMFQPDDACLNHKQFYVVKKDDEGLYINCGMGVHYLSKDQDGYIEEFERIA